MGNIYLALVIRLFSNEFFVLIESRKYSYGAKMSNGRKPDVEKNSNFYSLNKSGHSIEY